MNFGEALEELKNGYKMSRIGWNGWNGKGMFIKIQHPDAFSKMTKQYIYKKTAGGNLAPWLASHSDILANDWVKYV